MAAKLWQKIKKEVKAIKKKTEYRTTELVLRRIKIRGADVSSTESK